jgi:ADP-heptose:LPS heptosyltransferase/predicted SAM-dependent methyltransferase
MGHETSKCHAKRLARGDFDKYLKGRGIDIGCGEDVLRVPQGAVDPWDLARGDAQQLAGIPDESYDFVYSSHCLEDMRSIEEALANWTRVLRRGGALYLVVPDYVLYEKKRYPSVFNPDHKHTFSLVMDRPLVGRANHWHVDRDLAPLLDRLGVRIKERYLEDDHFDYGLGPEVDQTHRPQTLAQICVIGTKDGEANGGPAAAVSAASTVSEPPPADDPAEVRTPSARPLPVDPERQPKGLIGLLIEGGIGDALTSLTAMRWLKKAYPSSRFAAFLYEHSPGRAAGMLNVVETHPDLVGAFVVSNPEDVLRHVERPVSRVINISPWHFITAYFRARCPRLDYHLTPEDIETADRWLQRAGRPPLVVQPTASNPQVNWPMEHWQDLIQRLAGRFSPVIVGGAGEKALPGAALDLRGKLTARQTIAIVRRAAAVAAARSWVSIVSMDARIPTVVLSPTTRIHELRDYAYPPAYFEGETACLVNVAADARRVEEVMVRCLAKAEAAKQAMQPEMTGGGAGSG